MSYFFVHFLQLFLLPALLLALIWLDQRNIKQKPLLLITLISAMITWFVANSLPVTQIANLIVTSCILAFLLFFLVSQLLHLSKLNLFWHFILTSIVFLQWWQDPNLTAITNTDVINTDFILNFSAIIMATMLCLFMSYWLTILMQQSKIQQKLTALSTSLLILFTLLWAIPYLGQLLLSLMKLQVIDLTKVRLSLVAKSENINTYLNYILPVLLLMIILLFHYKVGQPRKQLMLSETDAIEKRKKTAHYFVIRKIILWGLTAIFVILTAQLYWDKVASQPPRLSDATPVSLNSEDKIHIPVAQVSDGKLHRFVWISDEGKAVRFFIINRLPDRISLAAVFDACILCGDKGYVMQDNQVVCVGCNVRMFTPSIGKPGGCNPIPIENWQQTDSEVIISKKSLEDGLNYFSTIMEIEVVDPVDGTKLKNTSTEAKYNFNGKTYFFANEKNLALFREQPEKYIK